MSILSWHCRGQLNDLCARIAEWGLKKSFVTNWGNVPEKLMLVVTELSEAMEAYRHIAWSLDLVEEPKPQENEVAANFREEIADAAIRIFHLAAALGIDLEDEIDKKMSVNEKRPRKHGKNC